MRITSFSDSCRKPSYLIGYGLQWPIQQSSCSELPRKVSNTVLKLYSVGYARGGSVIVALVLAEKQIPFELIVVNLEANEQKTPEFLEMHPFGQVPVIVSIIPRVFFCCSRPL